MDAKIDELFEQKYNKPSFVSNFKWQLALGIFVLGIIAGTGILTVSRKPASKTLEAVNTIEIGKESKLSFQFFSQDDMKDIVFNINLPGGVALASNPQKKDIHWKGDLVKGKNVICIYVKAQKEGIWEVAAQLQTNGTILKQFKMPIVIEKKG